MTRNQKMLVVLTSIMTVAVLAANLGAVKIWNFFGIPVDGGVIIFPLTYIVGDLLVELYGDKTADWVSNLAAIVNLVVVLLLIAVVFLPAYPSWDGQEAFSQVLGFSLRITIASLIAFVLSRRTNNWAFMKIKFRQKSNMYLEKFGTVVPPHVWSDQSLAELAQSDEVETRQLAEKLEDFRPSVVKGYQIRELNSSLLGRLVDNVIFETIAFLGVLPMADFAKQIVMAYVEGVVIEIVLILLVSHPAVTFCRKYIAEPRE